MTFLLRKYKIYILITFLTLLGAFLHFYNLNWGAPWYFHPDERNIASSVSQLQFPSQMNPHFFAYGSLPIYVIYGSGVLINFIQLLISSVKFQISNVSFSQAIIISRFYSALFATLLIPLLFLIGKKIKDTKTGLIGALLAATSVGLIQFAHFGTFELWLTFFTTVLFWLCLETIKNKSGYFALLPGLVFGILVATKISHLVILPLPVFALFIKHFQRRKNAQKNHNISFTRRVKYRISDMLIGNSLFDRRILFRFTGDIVLLCIIAAGVYFITNPFVTLDYPDFTGSMHYESGVALGTEPVFYTGEFFNTVPVMFQFLHIYPFLLNPLLTLLFIPSFLYLLFKAIKLRSIPYFLLLTSYLLLFIPQAFFYAKWTRYMVPTLPFMYLMIALAVSSLSPIRKFLPLFFTISTIFALSYFITAFVEPDTRIQAEQFAAKHIPSDAPILSEVYDLGITPFNNDFHTITLFNFYDLDNNSFESTPQTLQDKFAATGYIILPSQRILKTRLINPIRFPKAYVFYHTLVSGSSGFKKIYETPCDVFCIITYLGNPVYSFEETANVFDRPEVFIYKRK